MQENSPRHLDSTASYWANDTTFTYQIYEPLYGYHYLKRPYQLIGKSAQGLAAFTTDPRWSPAADGGVREWTDDYTNIFGSMMRSMQGH